MLFDLEEELKKLPASPGVYLMHNNRDEIIYVGKAISLKDDKTYPYIKATIWEDFPRLLFS